MNGGGGGPGPQQLLRPQQPHRAAQPQHLGMAAAAPPAGAVGAEAEVELTNLGREEQHSSAVCVALALSIVLVFVLLFNLDAILEGSSSQLSSSPGSRSTTTAADREGVRAGSFFSSSSSSSSTSFVSRYASDSPYRYAMGPAATDRADAIAAAAAEAEEEAAAEEEGRTHAGRITPLSSYLLQLESRSTRRPVLLGMDRTRKYSLHFNSEFFFFVFDPTHKQQEQQQQNLAAENDAASGGEGKRPVASTPGGTLFPAAADVGTSGGAAADPPNVQRDTAMPPFSPPSFSPAGPLFSPSASPAPTSSSASAASSTASVSSPSPPPFSAYSFPSSLSTTSGSSAASSTDGSSSSSSFPFSSRALSLVTSGAAGVYLYTTRTIFHSIRLALLRIHLHVSGALAPAAGAPFSLSFLPTPLAAALSPLWRVFIDRDLYLSGLDVRDTHKLHFQGAAPLYKLPVQRGLQLHAAGRGGAAGGGGSAGAGAGTDGSQEDERDAGVPWCTYTATFHLRFEPGLGRSAREADDAAAGEIFYKAIKDGDIMRYAAWAAPSIRQEAAEVEDEEEEAAAAAGYADQRQQLLSWRRRLRAEDAGAADARGKAAGDGRTHAPRRKREAVAAAVEDAGEMGAARLAGGAAPRRGVQGASGARRNRSSEPKERRSKQRKRRRSKTGDSSSSSRKRSRRYSRKTRAGASGAGARSINSDVDNATTGRAITAGAAPSSSSFRAASSSPESGSGVFRGSGGAPIPAAVAAPSSAKEGGGQRRELATAADEVSAKYGTEGRPVEDGPRRVSLKSAAAASASPAPAAQAEAATVPAAAATPAAAGLVAAGEEMAVGREAGKVSRDGTLSQTGAPSSAAATAAAVRAAVRAAVSAAGAAPPVAASAALAAAAAVGAPAAIAGAAAATTVAGDSEGETVGEARAEGLEELWTLGEGQHGGNDRAALPPVPAIGQTSAAVASSRLHSPSAVGDGRAWASRGGSARERPIIEREGQHIRKQQQEVRREEEQTQEPESEQQQHPEEEGAEGTRDQRDQGRVAKGQEQKLSEEQQRSRTRSRKRGLDGKQQQKSETETAGLETRVLGGEGRRRNSKDGRERTGRAGQQQRNTGRMLLAPVDVLSDVRGAEDYFTWQQQQQHLLQGGDAEEERDSDDVAEALFEENEDEERRREIGVEEEAGMGAGDSILGSDDLLLNSSSAHGRDSMYGVRRRRGRRRIGGGGLGGREGSMWYGRQRRGDSRSGRLDFFQQDEEDEEPLEEEVQEEEENADLESGSFFAEERDGEETEEETRGRTGLGTSGRGGAGREAGAGDEEGTRAGGAARKEDMQEGVLSRKYQRLPDVYGELLSSDCGFYIFFKAWEVDYVRLASHITSLTLIFNMKTLVEMRLFWKQMQHTQGTAATATAGGAAAAALLHRVSVLGIAWLAAVDIFEAVAILRVALLLQIMMPYFFILVMFKFVLFGALEVRYLLTVWNAHQQLTHPPESEALGRATTRLYKSFYGSLALLVLFVYHIFPLCPLLCAPLYFFWVPQIVWDVWRGQRNSLDLQFVAGISLCRLVFPAYFFACPASLFVDAFVESHAPSFFALGLITCILLAQVLLMLGQRRFGSRFFVPLEWLPHVYNYHRPLPSFFEEDAEGGLPECAICMNPVDGKSRNRSITPCDHLFHDKCLQQWMEVKMECPNCRGVLPPFP